MKKVYHDPIMDIDEFKVAEIMTYSDIIDPDDPDSEF